MRLRRSEEVVIGKVGREIAEGSGQLREAAMRKRGGVGGGGE